MIKWSSLKFSLGNITLFIGLLLLVGDFIFLVYARDEIGSRAVMAGLGGVAGAIACISMGLIAINIDRKLGEKGVVIGQDETHHIKAISKGKKVFLYVDGKPELEFFGKYRRAETAGTTIGDKEKHKVDVEVRVSTLSGNVDKWVYVDGELALKDEKPLW